MIGVLKPIFLTKYLCFLFYSWFYVLAAIQQLVLMQEKTSMKGKNKYYFGKFGFKKMNVALEIFHSIVVRHTNVVVIDQVPVPRLLPPFVRFRVWPSRLESM